MTAFNLHMMDEANATPWERYEAVDEETGEPTGEFYETRTVPSVNVGGGDHQHYGFQTRPVGPARTLEDWRLQQSDADEKPAASPWFSFETVNDKGKVNGVEYQRLVLTDAGTYKHETRHTPAP